MSERNPVRVETDPHVLGTANEPDGLTALTAAELLTLTGGVSARKWWDMKMAEAGKKWWDM